MNLQDLQQRIKNELDKNESKVSVDITIDGTTFTVSGTVPHSDDPLVLEADSQNLSLNVSKVADFLGHTDFVKKLPTSAQNVAIKTIHLTFKYLRSSSSLVSVSALLGTSIECSYTTPQVTIQVTSIDAKITDPLGKKDFTVTLKGTIKPTHLLPTDVSKFLSKKLNLNIDKNQSLNTTITIKNDPDIVILKASLTDNKTPFDLSKSVSFSDPCLQVDLSGEDSSVGIGGTISVTANSQNLSFDGQFDVTATEANFSLTQTGDQIWKNAFGVNDLNVSELAGTLGMSYDDGLPSIALTGQFNINDFSGGITFAINSSEPTKSMFSASMKKAITLKEVVNTFCDESVTIPSSLSSILDEVSISSAEIYFAPNGATIGEKTFPAGYRFDGTLNFYDLQSTVKVQVDPSKGIEFDADMNKSFAIGGENALVLAAADGKKGGPTISISTLPDNPHLHLSGKATLGEVFSDSVDISFGDENFSFSADSKIFGVYDSTISVDSAFSDLQSSSLKINITIHPSSLSRIEDDVFNSVKNDIINSSGTLSTLQKANNDAKGAWDKIKGEKDSCEKNINEWKSKLRALGVNI